MTIQTLTEKEINHVSGGLTLDLNSLLGGLPAIGGLLTNAVGLVSNLLKTITGLFQSIGLSLLVF